MSTRRDFLVSSAGLIGAAVPLIGRSQTLPCPPPQVSIDGGNSASTSCVSTNVPSYISSMNPFQVRSLSGTYAPSNGTSTIRSVMPSMWSGNDDIIRPWSGGAKSTTGTKMYVHGGGHSDSSNNGLFSFDFAGSAKPTGWAVEHAGQTGISSDLSIGGTGAPISVHTYDGMVDMGSALYRFGGSTYPTGGFGSQMMRYDKSTSTWTRLPNWASSSPQFAGSAIANLSARKILAMDRFVSFFTYGFYRVATNNWSTRSSVSAQWPGDFSSAFDPATNTGLVIGANNESGVYAFSLGINWSAETITQTPRSITGLGAGCALIWDPTRGRYWCFGSSNNSSTLYEINPSTFAVTPHPLTGDVPAPETPYWGTFGRWVFMDSWRAIGSVSNRGAAAFVIRLP